MNQSWKWYSKGILGLALPTLLIGCFGQVPGDSNESSGTSAGETATIQPSTGTLSSSSHLELQKSNSEVSLKDLAQGLFGDFCTFNSSSSSAGLLGTNGSTYIMSESPLLPTTTYLVSEIRPYIARTGTLTGSFIFEARKDDGANRPDLTTSGLMGTTTPYNGMSLSTSLAHVPLTFTTAVQITSGVKVHFVLKGGTDWVDPANGNYVSWAKDNASNCTSSNFGIIQRYTSSWSSTSPNNGLIQAVKQTFNTSSPFITYVADAGASADWLLDTFAPTENPNSELGSITYDIGASDSTTASYSDTNLTQAQVRAAATRTGRYLFIKAKLISTDGLKDATLGKITVNYRKL